MYFRLTLFNCITLFLILVTGLMAYARFRVRLENTWLLLYYVAVLAYWKGFPYSLNTWWVFTGLATAALLRFEFLGGKPLRFVRVVELVVFGYIVCRSLSLLLQRAGWWPFW